MIIDCETHIFQVIDLPGYKRFSACRVENLLEDMDRAGVEKTILTSYDPADLAAPDNPLKDPTYPSLGNNPIGYFIESWQKHKDRFYWFSCPDPRKPGCIPLLEQHYRLGMVGLGELCPAYQHLLPNSAEMRRLYCFAADNGLPVILNSENWDEANDYFVPREFDEYFAMMEAVFREFKDVRFMIGHGGGDCGRIVHANHDPAKYIERNLRSYRLAAELDNLWVCSCMPWWFSHGQIKADMLKTQLESLRTHVGFERVSWGSDWPWIPADMAFNCDYKVVVDYYRNFQFCTSEERERLLGRSASEFVAGPSGSDLRC